MSLCYFPRVAGENEVSMWLDKRCRSRFRRSQYHKQTAMSGKVIQHLLIWSKCSVGGLDRDSRRRIGDGVGDWLASSATVT